MNLATIRSQARRKSGIASANFSDSALDEQINIAYFQLASIVAELQEDYYEEQNTKFNLIANSSLYSLPTDLIKFKQLRLAYTTPSSRSDYRVARHYDPSDVHSVSEQEEGASTSFPIRDLTNNYVRIKPTPTASVTDGGLLWYIARPSALVQTGDAPVLPTQYHDYIAVYAAKEMTFKFEKWKKHDRLLQQWNDFISPLMTRITEMSDRDLGAELRFKAPQEVGIGGPTREMPDDF